MQIGTVSLIRYTALVLSQGRVLGWSFGYRKLKASLDRNRAISLLRMGWCLRKSSLQRAGPHHRREMAIGKIAGFNSELLCQPRRSSPVAHAELRNDLPQGLFSGTYPKPCDGFQQGRGQLLPSIGLQLPPIRHQLPSIGPELPPIGGINTAMNRRNSSWPSGA